MTGIPVFAPADTARAVAQVYTLSLVAAVPLLLTLLTALALRRASPGTRAVVWRSAVLALVVIAVGQLAARPLLTWLVPGALASPLVALGRLELLDAEGAGGSALWPNGVLLAVYGAGVALVLVPALRGWGTRRALVRRARPAGPEWQALLARAARDAGLSRQVRLLVADDIATPLTWGLMRPVVVLPHAANRWSAADRRATLVHELSHVQALDAPARLAARVACALLWFHPVIWWIARRLHEDGELACDARVIAAGVRRSDYASLLLRVAQRSTATTEFAPALAPARGLRARLAAIVDLRRAAVLPARWLAPGLATLALSVALPLGTVRLAPSRDVLTTLMRDASWEWRAYAIVGLAQRPDSVDVARHAAARDPNPRVRAWAAQALASSSRN